MKDINQKTTPEDGSAWDNRYLNNETGWDLHEVSPPLKKYIDSIPDKNISILIPGCGNAYEAAYLLQQGFQNVTVVDISKVLTERLRERFKDSHLTIHNLDFFDLDGKFDLILEQTFFCALHPSLRKKYVQKCYDLLRENGKIAGVLFHKKFTETEPPFCATRAEYRELFEPKFNFLVFKDSENSVPSRMGYETMFTFQKKSGE